MTLTDILLSTLILVVIGLIFYLKATKQTFKDLMIDLKDLIKTMRDKNV
jgi:hypothetical protein